MTTQIAEYSATEAGLAELRSRLGNVVYDVTTGAGMEKARKDRRECVTLRTDLEALRVKIKAPALERCRLIDAEAKAITGEILALEGPIDSQIKAEEGRKEAERKAREAKEKARIDAINAKIAGIRGYVTDAIGVGSSRIAKMVDDMTATVVDEAGYAELAYLGVQARDETLAKLKEMHAAAIANEAEAARLMAERLELERERQAQEAAAQAERDRIAAEDRVRQEAARIEAAAERKRLDDEARAARAEREATDAKAKAERDEQDRLAREQRALDEARARAERAAEDKRLAVQRAALETERAELRKARDPMTALRRIAAIVRDDFLTDGEARAQVAAVCTQALQAVLA